MTLGLRARVTLMFAAGATVLAVTGAVTTYTTARSYLISQREESATRQAFADASFVRDGLGTSGVAVSDVLGAVTAPAGAQILVDRGGQRFSTTLDVSLDDLPGALTTSVGEGSAAVAWTVVGGEPVLAVGLPLPAVDADFYEVSSVGELHQTLTTLQVALAACALLMALGGAGLGSWTSRRALVPLHRVARTAAVIAGGEVGTRLPTTEDPDLATIVGSFNSMVEALEEQIAREARFSADVSHELRSPLTTLVTGVDLLRRRRAELPDRSRQALDLVGRELDRFSRTLDDLLELAVLESGSGNRERTPVDLADLAAQVLRDRSCGAPLDRPGRPVPVVVDEQQISRAVVNLLDNADRYAGGATGISVLARAGDALLVVDDDGPGVPAADRERIFDRFARAGSRGALAGAGLGLSLVGETAKAHGGAVWCSAPPDGGARFVLRLPLAEDVS